MSFERCFYAPSEYGQALTNKRSVTQSPVFDDDDLDAGNRQACPQEPVVVPVNAALSLLSANEPGPLLPHSRGYTIIGRSILAAFVAPACILIAIYLGLWCLDFSTLRPTYRSLFLNCIIYKLGALVTY